MNEKPECMGAVRSWVQKGEHDIEAAERILTPVEGCPFDTVCFHAQQCAEKYLKALLVLHSVEFPKTHNLRLLIQLVPAGLSLGLETDRVVALIRYAVDVRYSDELQVVTPAAAEEAVATARKVREAVRQHLPGEALAGQ